MLAVTNMYPTPGDPAYGAFVRSQMASVAAIGPHVEVDFIDGRKSAWQYARAVPRLRQRVRSGSFDLVHAHYGLTGIVAAVQPLPLVVSFCGDDLLGTPDGHGGTTTKSRAFRWLSQLAALRADAVICKSAELRDALRRADDRRRAWVIPNGVDLELFSPGSRAEARSRLGFDEHEHLVLFPHTPAVARKRVDLAHDAIRELAALGRAARLLLVSGVAQTDMPDFYRAGCRLVKRNTRAIAEGLAQVLAGDRRIDGSEVRTQIGLPAIAQQLVRVYHEAIAHRTGRAR